MKLSNILVGMALVIIVSTGFLLFMTNGISKYSPTVPSDYNESFSRLQNNLDDLSSNINRTETELNRADGDDNMISDFLGFLFGGGYRAAKVLVGGIELNSVIANEVVDNSLGETGLGETIYGVILLLIFIFIVLLLLHFVIKSEWI